LKIDVISKTCAFGLGLELLELELGLRLGLMEINVQSNEFSSKRSKSKQLSYWEGGLEMTMIGGNFIVKNAEKFLDAVQNFRLKIP